MHIYGYDTETWSSNPINRGLEHYFAAHDFDVIVAAVATDAGNQVANFQHNLGMMDAVGTLMPAVLAAHNMPFDRGAIQSRFPDLELGGIYWFDTAVGVRALLGASNDNSGTNSSDGVYLSLDKCAKLLLDPNHQKDPDGVELMQYFSIPSKHNDYGKIKPFEMMVRHPDKWERYRKYCGQDAVVARELAVLVQDNFGPDAFRRMVVEAEITYQMNQRGWPVDTYLLQKMIDRAAENSTTALTTLIDELNPGFTTTKKNGTQTFKPLNINSGSQIIKWAGERGVILPNAQKETLEAALDTVQDDEVRQLIQVKLDLGGATLKKLEPIQQNLSADGRLRNMYNHIGAAATHRTTGSGVQMQNLKRLPDEDDLLDLSEDAINHMTNSELAMNIRQLFASPDPDGRIVVADLKSIEGLLVGWVFGVDWMVEAVEKGLDMYKQAAAQRWHMPYDMVTPQQRRTAKTGVLAGNYGGGAKAYVKASNGALDEVTAADDVKAYRNTVPNLVQSWWDLDEALFEAVRVGHSMVDLHRGYSVFMQTEQPMSQLLQEPTLSLNFMKDGTTVFTRFWHGVRIEKLPSPAGGLRDAVTYAMLDNRKTATQLWKRANATGDPYTLYGGKLTGTIIQSLARETYFYQLRCMAPRMQQYMIGQLHDELNAEAVLSDANLAALVDAIERAMQATPWYLSGCPIKAKVSYARRYIK